MPKDNKNPWLSHQNETQHPYNDRLFLELIRESGEMSKAELTRSSGLSAQSSTVIVKRLVDQGLLKAGEVVKGRIGQPSTPFSLRPEGATSIGVKIGRRSLEVATMSFDYRIIASIVQRYDFPQFKVIRKKIKSFIDKLTADFSPAERDRISGIGIALPDDLSAWEQNVGAPDGAMSDWNEANLNRDLQEQYGWPVYTLNDASAACLAELATGNPDHLDSFVYIYVGTFIGGGIVIGGRLYSGHSQLAGAFASMPTSSIQSGVSKQLLEGPSLHSLEERVLAEGLEPNDIYNIDTFSPDLKKQFNAWLEGASTQIAFAAMSAQALIDPEGIVIDSSLPEALTRELVEATKASLATHYDNRGLRDIKVSVGTHGISARAIGSGIVPLMSEFGASRERS